MKNTKTFSIQLLALRAVGLFGKFYSVCYRKVMKLVSVLLNIVTICVLLSLLLLVLKMIYIPPLVLAGENCTEKNAQFTLDPDTPGEYSTWNFSFSPSEEVTAYNINICFNGTFKSGKTQIYLSGWPLHYDLDTIGCMGGSGVSINYWDDAITMSPSQVYSVRVKDIINPDSPTVLGGWIFDSPPNTSAHASCRLGTVPPTAPTPTDIPMPPTSTPIPPTNTPIPTTAVTTPLIPTLDPTLTLTPPVVPATEPTSQSKPTTSENPQTIQPPGAKITPAITISEAETKPQKLTPTPIIDLSLLKEKGQEQIDHKKMAKAILLGELTSVVFVGMIVSSILLRSHL